MRLLVIAGFAESIVPFRGALISDLSHAGCEVHVAAPGLDSQLEIGSKLGLGQDRLHDISMARAGTNPLTDLQTLASLYRLMRRLQPDAVLPYTIKPVVYGTLAAWLARVPTRFALITGMGYAFTGERGLLTILIRHLYRIALGRTNKVFLQNPDDEQLLRRLGLLPASVPSVVVNGSGVDLATFGEEPLPPALIFLMIARLLGDKGVREYAEAACRIREEHPGAVFRLAGWIDANPDAIRPAELEAWIAEGTIDFLGKLDDVRPAIAASAVYVLPSYREGTPRTVLEAMAMGRPIITTDAPGCRETVIDGDNGFLVPVQSVDALVEAMLKFIKDPTLPPRMGRRSRQIAEDKYDVHKVNAVMLREMGITRAATEGEAQV